jgi:hypothetical protein
VEGQQAQVDPSQLREREAGYDLQKYTSRVTAYIHVHSLQIYVFPGSAFRNIPPGSRPTYTFTAFRYMFFLGHGLHKNIHFFSVHRMPPLAASYRKPFAFTVYRRPSRVNGLQKTTNLLKLYKNLSMITGC